uniref:Uncharacterized protein n=1 Tax=uncultured marine virus TaxID=186617 RepID=A0A0F7L4M7_9VIRU|nr:hypothetical protein [uncultured marine virus]
MSRVFIAGIPACLALVGLALIAASPESVTNALVMVGYPALIANGYPTEKDRTEEQAL